VSTTVLPEGVWIKEDTTPSEVDEALRRLLEQSYAAGDGIAPARVVNLVAVIDRDWRGEILNRLERVGRYHPSRTVICTFHERRDRLDARVTLRVDSVPGGLATVSEQVELEIGPRHLERLDSIVDPLIIRDLITVVWSPHRHPEAEDALRGIADVVLLDSQDEADLAAAVRRSCDLARQTYVVDLAWLRSTPWRERIAATFDPPAWRPALREISSVTVRHRQDSAIAGMLMLGWFSSRLGWKPGTLVGRDGTMQGHARAAKLEVDLQLRSVDEMSVPGLAGVTVETASGVSLSLDRGRGGLSAHRRLPDGRESSWVVLGASRGEAGILGEGIRQALLRDPTYGPAVACAEVMVG
jgi:glucose-6-phosphate dehydrogenase assembly protein OpcA